LESIVKAQPSTAMSWVAAQKFKIKKLTVKFIISGEEAFNIASNLQDKFFFHRFTVAKIASIYSLQSDKFSTTI